MIGQPPRHLPSRKAQTRLAEQKPPRPNPQSGRPSTTARSAPARRDSRASALHEAIAHSVQTDREFKKKSTISSGEGRRNGLIVLTVLMSAFTLYAWIGRPAFIWGPPITPPPPEVQEANLRMAMFVLGMRVDRFKKEHRAYPQSLSEVGDSIRGMSYQRLNDSTFELRGKAANREIVFRNTMASDEFLGNTKDIIQTRRKR